jgi:hypothetical protein
MMHIRNIVVGLVVTSMLGAEALLIAQTASAPKARHVRSAPLQTARRVGEPILNEVGSFTPLPPSPHSASIFGIVQTQVGVLVPKAGKIIIRDLRTGAAVARAEVNDLAQFTVRGLAPGTYTTELMNSAGALIASSPGFYAAAGEVVHVSQTIHVLPLDGFARVLSSATSSALSAAASSGVLAVAPGAPASPGS